MNHLLLVALLLPVLSAMDVAEALPLTERIIMVHLDDGHVQHHGKGEKRGAERVVATPVDAALAAKPEAWAVSGGTTAGIRPLRVGRKSKGTDFAWMVEGWDQKNNRALNKSLDHASEHWFYLHLPEAMVAGVAYTVTCQVPGIAPLTLSFAADGVRSEAVHVNLIGYVTDAPAKFAYVHHWQGDLGSLDLSWLAGKRFRLIDQASGKAVFTGPVTFRAPANQRETIQANDTPMGSFLAAEVWECDFSAFATPGSYIVAVDGIGCSFPFAIGPDVYREAFHLTTRALYHNRSGIALAKPYTEFERPAPHHVRQTPGFAGQLKYTRSRFADWTNEDAAPADKAAIEAGIVGPLEDTWGWYQDAGDWDSYESHLNVASCLLFAYELAPRNFSDGELNIPESGNGVPDLLDEAAWLPRFGQRLRQELLKKGWGTGGIGLRVCGDHFGGDGEGVPSYEDVHRTWIVSGEDPWSTFRYAGVAAHLAFCLRLAGVKDPAGVDWQQEAVESYAWAVAHCSEADEQKRGASVRVSRAYAAAALFRLTGGAAYEAQLDRDTAHYGATATVWETRAYGPWIHCLGGGAPADAALVARLRAPVLHTIRLAAIDTPAKRALRWGGNFDFPMLIGHQTTPWILEGMVGYALLRESDPVMAKACKAAVHTSCDYVLGTNALNHTWVTGLGTRHVNQVFHIDAWYNGKPTAHPGIIPYGPWRKARDLGQGPWDADWPNGTLHPPIDQWPGNERWYDNRCAPLNAEFTIHQTNCFAAAIFGWLCAPLTK